MSGQEFLIRSLVAGLVLGLPAYLIGSLNYAGRGLPMNVVRGIGAMSGFLAAGAGLAGWASWGAVLAVGLIGALIGAVVFGLAIKLQDALPQRWRK